MNRRRLSMVLTSIALAAGGFAAGALADGGPTPGVSGSGTGPGSGGGGTGTSGSGRGSGGGGGGTTTTPKADDPTTTTTAQVPAPTVVPAPAPSPGATPASAGPGPTSSPTGGATRRHKTRVLGRKANGGAAAAAPSRTRSRFQQTGGAGVHSARTHAATGRVRAVADPATPPPKAVLVADHQQALPAVARILHEPVARWIAFAALGAALGTLLLLGAGVWAKRRIVKL